MKACEVGIYKPYLFRNSIPRSRILKGNTPFQLAKGLEEGLGVYYTLNGNEAVAIAASQANPHVVAAYPITPGTPALHGVCKNIADGRLGNWLNVLEELAKEEESLNLDLEGIAREVVRGKFGGVRLINAASEHDAMSSCIGASAAGARVFTVTASVGFVYMHEMAYWAAGARLPIVIGLANRCNGASLNIWGDKSDLLSGRDFLVILVAEDVQQSYDNTLQAFRIAEHPEVQTIVSTNWDGFFLSHRSEKINVLPDEEANGFVGKFEPITDALKNSSSLGGLTSPFKYPIVRAQQAYSANRTLEVIQEVHDEYREISGRASGAYFNTYCLEGAELVIFNMGSLSGTIRRMIDIARRDGVAVGLVNLRTYRPFPRTQLAELMKEKGQKVKAIGVMDNTLDSGPGALFTDLTSALRRMDSNIADFKYGGGYNPTLADINGIFHVLQVNSKKEYLSPEDEIRALNYHSDPPYSLRWEDSEARDLQEDTYSVKFVGRGGEGAVIVSEMLVKTRNEGEDFAVSTPRFGSEKTGSPTDATAYISKVRNPDKSDRGHVPKYLVAINATVLDGDLNTQISEDGWLIVNTPKTPSQIRDEFGLLGRKIATIDATTLSLEKLRKNIPNIVMLAALAVTNPEVITIEEVKEAVLADLGKKYGRDSETVRSNLELIELVQQNIQIEEV